MSDTLSGLCRAPQFLQRNQKALALAIVLLASAGIGSAQSGPEETQESSSRKTKIERGVLEFNFETGWAFRLPAPYLTIESTDGTTATARLNTTRMAPSAGVRFWANRWVGVSVDVLGSDGTASAELDTAKATAHQRFVAVYFGAEAQHARGPIRPYVHFGGGPLRVSQQLGFFNGQSWTRWSEGAATAGSFRTGGGVRFLCSPRWGVRFGAELVHYSANGVGAHTFGRATAGFFFRTRGRPAQ